MELCEMIVYGNALLYITHRAYFKWNDIIRQLIFTGLTKKKTCIFFYFGLYKYHVLYRKHAFNKGAISSIHVYQEEIIIRRQLNNDRDGPSDETN